MYLSLFVCILMFFLKIPIQGMYVERHCGISWVILIFCCMCGPRDGGRGLKEARDPLKNHKHIGFLAIQVQITEKLQSHQTRIQCRANIRAPAKRHYLRADMVR